MAAAGFRHSGKSRAKSSTQGWSPNSGQVAEDASRNPDLVLASQHEQQSSASNLTLPLQQNQQAGIQMQSASSLDQPQNESVQYQPTGNNPEPPTTDATGQHQPSGNNETPLAGDDLNSNVIVNAQLTHLVSRNDAAQGQDAPNVPDAPMPDAPTVHDIATPRRRCRKWSSSNKDTWGMAALVVRGLLRRPSLSGFPTGTFCSVHEHNKVAKKRDASASLLQRLYAHMVQHNVDSIGGDFNMSGFSRVCDDFSDSELVAPSNALLWGIGGLDGSCKDRTGRQERAQTFTQAACPARRLESCGHTAQVQSSSEPHTTPAPAFS